MSAETLLKRKAYSLQPKNNLQEDKEFEHKIDDQNQSLDGLDEKGNVKSSLFCTSDFRWLAMLTGLAFIVRLAVIHHPSVVIFDEVHFGGFAKKYLTREFFIDLHPPLARLLVTFSAWVGGFKGEFDFYAIGADYSVSDAPFVVMRLFCAVAGALVIPIAYTTMRAMKLRQSTSAVCSAMIIFDNALTTQSRLIFLDSYLILFSTLVPLFWVLMRREEEFSIGWKLSLFGLGCSISLAASCKWVGLFAVAAVGIYTVSDLWSLWCDWERVTLRKFLRHFTARSIALIVVPLVIYAASFVGHFRMQDVWDSHAAGMSIEYQQSLKGGELPSTPRHVYYGSMVRLRQYRESGPYLHSHKHTYPTGSKQQQVTGYHHRDNNNLWVIRRPYEHIQPTEEELNIKEAERNISFFHRSLPFENSQRCLFEEEAIEIFKAKKAEEEKRYRNSNRPKNLIFYSKEPKKDERKELKRLYSGDQIRLEHIVTSRYLHSHQMSPPISNKEKQNEVSGYGSHRQNIGDLNDNWQIEAVDSKGHLLDDADEENDAESKITKKRGIDAIETKFRLTHVLTSSLLHCRGKTLPDWGYKQSEITCGREMKRTNTIWLIELNDHPLIDADSLELVRYPKLNFIFKFIELNKRMWNANAGLSANHYFASRPTSWPFLSRGLGFWNGNHTPPTRKEHKLKKSKKKDQDSEDDSYDSHEEEEEEASDDKEEEEEEKSKDVDPEETKEKSRLRELYKQFKGKQIYLIGNPIVWWTSSASLLIVAALFLVERSLAVLKPAWSKKIKTSPFSPLLQSDGATVFLMVQWIWHFLPFFGMGRQLFLHHYLPALYFSILVMSALLDSLVRAVENGQFLRSNGKHFRLFFLSLLFTATLIVFVKFSPLSYGLGMSSGRCKSLKWLSGWDFDCSIYD